MSQHRRLRPGQDALDTPLEVKEALHSSLQVPKDESKEEGSINNQAEQILFCRPPLSPLAMMNKDHVLVVIITSLYTLLIIGVITLYEVHTYQGFRWIFVWISMALVCTLASFVVALKCGLYSYAIITNLRVAAVIPRKFPFFVKPVVQSVFFKHNFQKFSQRHTNQEGKNRDRVESLLKVIHSKNEENVGRIIAFGDPTIQLEGIQEIDVVEDTLTSIVQKIAMELDYHPKKLELKRLERFKNEKDYKMRRMPFIVMRYVSPSIAAVIIWASAIYSCASIRENPSFADIFPIVIFFTIPFYFVLFIVILLRPITQDLEAIREERSFQIGYFTTEHDPESSASTSVSIWA